MQKALNVFWHTYFSFLFLTLHSLQFFCSMRNLFTVLLTVLILVFNHAVHGGNLEYVSGIPGTVNDVKVSGNLAYCAANNGLLILDYTNPQSPQFKSYLPLPDAAGSIAVQGSYAYVMARTAGLRIINVEDPLHPFETGSYQAGPSSQGWGLAVQGNYAYLAYGMEGFRIVDISNPASPVETGAFFLPEADIFSRVAVDGNVAFTNVGNIIYALNVENPQTPVLLGTKTIIGEISDMEIRQNHLICVSNFNDFSSSFYGLVVLDKSNPAAITQVGQYDTDVYSYKLSISGNLCYLGNGTAGVAVMSVDALGLVSYIGNAGGFSAPVRFAEVWNDRLFTGGEKMGLQLHQLIAPAELSLLSAYRTLYDARDIQISGNYTYIADGRNGLVVADVSNPVLPFVAGQKANSGNGLGIALNGNFAYLADGEAGVSEYNVSNAANPLLTGSVVTDNWAQDIVIRNNIGYVAVDVLGLQLLNLSIPGLPSAAGSAFDLTGTSYGVALHENYALLASGGAGLHLVDVTLPAQPALVSTYNTPGSAYDVFVSDNKAYVADSQGGLIIIDISNPAIPQALGQSTIPGDARQVIVAGSYAFVADWNHGLRIFNISNPAAITESYNFEISGTAHNIAVYGEYIYVASGTAGLTILRNPLSTSAENAEMPVNNISAYPNPFQGAVMLQIQANKASMATLRLYDETGRELIRFSDQNLKQGINVLNLSEANSLISNLKPGIYILKSDFAGISRAIKLVKR